MLEQELANLTVEITKLRLAIEDLTRRLEREEILGQQLNLPLEDLPAIFNEKEAAAYLKLTISRLRHWRGQRKGPAFRKIGASVRYAKADLDRWLHEQGLLSNTTAPPAEEGSPPLSG